MGSNEVRIYAKLRVLGGWWKFATALFACLCCVVVVAFTMAMVAKLFMGTWMLVDWMFAWLAGLL